MHAKERREQITGTGALDKTILVGVLERGGSVRARFVPDRSAKSLMGFINDNAAENSTLYTDLFHTYAEAGQTFQHAIVDRNFGEYVNGLVHTNGSENFWSIPQRTIKGAPFRSTQSTFWLTWTSVCSLSTTARVPTSTGPSRLSPGLPIVASLSPH